MLHIMYHIHNIQSRAVVSNGSRHSVWRPAASQLTVCLLYSPSTNTVANTEVQKTFDTGTGQIHLSIHKERDHVNSVSNVVKLNYLGLIGLQKLCLNVRPTYPNAKRCVSFYLYPSISIIVV